jgi:hypothetical protein
MKLIISLEMKKQITFEMPSSIEGMVAYFYVTPDIWFSFSR